MASLRLRPTARRLALIIAVGPLVGAGIVFLFTLTNAVPHLTADDVTAMAGLIIVIGWVLGLVPATLSALVVHRIGLAAAMPRRVAEAAAIGGLCGLVVLPVLFGFSIPPWQSLAIFGTCGAVALCATAVPGLGER